MNQSLEKRTHVYLMPPSSYDIAPCSCGNHHTQWSEYKKHLWCSKCEIDFIPNHNGIFDGPIPINMIKSLGVSLSRQNLKNNKIECVNSAGNYQVSILWEDVFKQKEIAIDITEYNEAMPVGKAYLDYKSGELRVEFFNGKGNFFSTEIFFHELEGNRLYTKAFVLTVEPQNEVLHILEDEKFKEFNQYVLNKSLNYSLNVNQDGKKKKI